MSRTVAKILHAVMDVATLPLSKRQREKTIARVAEDISMKSVREVITSHGNLKFYAMRGAYTASAIENFGKDEPETLAWIDTYIQADDIVWDIGANIGLYALYAAQKGARVYAFEPSALNYALLCEHIYLNRMDDRISPLCVALSDQTKIDYLHMQDFAQGHASNSVGQAQTQFEDFNPAFSQSIPAFTSNDFCSIFDAPKPAHIKLDVDGIEERILAGMEEILPHVTTLTIEVEGQNAEDSSAIEGYIFKSGLQENVSHREKGSRRNRLYTR